MMKGSAKRLKRALGLFPLGYPNVGIRNGTTAREGAALFPKLVKDFQLTEDIYRQSGTVILRPAAALADLAHLAEERKQTAPEIGEITMLSAVQTAKFLPLLKETPSLFISGGGRLDGPAYLNHLQKRAEAKGVTFVHNGRTFDN